jgi:hypothetical protein
MAVTNLSENDGKLTLELDNGDYKKFKQAMEKWNFKDEQSLMRFVVSILVLSEDKIINVKIDNDQKNIVPADDFLKK